MTRPGTEPRLPGQWRTLYPLDQRPDSWYWPGRLIFQITVHNAFTFRFWSCFSSPCWHEPLDNFLFLSSWRSFKWSFLVSRIPLENCTTLPEPSNMSVPAKIILLVLCDHVLYSSLLSSFLALDVLTRRYSQHRSFHNPSFPNWNFYKIQRSYNEWNIESYNSNYTNKYLIILKLTLQEKIRLLLFRATFSLIII